MRLTATDIHADRLPALQVEFTTTKFCTSALVSNARSLSLGAMHEEVPSICQVPSPWFHTQSCISAAPHFSLAISRAAWRDKAYRVM